MATANFSTSGLIVSDCPQMFLALSIIGTFFNAHFFAFHMLNIVNNNQLLSGVIKAVTQNGEMW